MKNESNPNHSAHVVALCDVEKHPNADRLLKAKAFGAGIIVGLDSKEGDIGIYFQSDLALNYDFAVVNDLIRRKNPETGVQEGGMLDSNCRIRTQKFRGEVSDGLFLPLSCLSGLGISEDTINNLIIGDYFEELDGIKICTKYVPKFKSIGGTCTTLKKSKGSIMFKEHYETSQLRFNLDKIKPSDYVVITEKLHGTSQRVGNVQKVTNFGPIKTFISKLFGFNSTKTEWEDLVGTRRTVVSNGGYYSTDFRFEAALPFFDKLHKGETVYYEVVGYADEKPIMGTVDNTKLGDEFVKKYGKTTTFSYGCELGQFDIYVYRITLTNEDAYTIDYTWDAIVKRCAELGIKHVPILFNGPICGISYDGLSFSDNVLALAEDLVKGESTVDARHIREGIVIRVEGTSCPTTYKHKSFEFKVLSGNIKPETSGIDNTEEL